MGENTHMSSKGEIKISLNEMICQTQTIRIPFPRPVFQRLTFSCLRCFKSFNSRYVLLLRTGVEKGFMIFLMATAVPPSWSLAEQTRPKAPGKGNGSGQSLVMGLPGA